MLSLNPTRKSRPDLQLCTALIAHLRSQFNPIFALLNFTPRFQNINFQWKKSKIFFLINKFSSTKGSATDPLSSCWVNAYGGLLPQTPWPLAAGSCHPKYPHCSFLSTQHAELTASIQKLILV